MPKTRKNKRVRRQRRTRRQRGGNVEELSMITPEKYRSLPNTEKRGWVEASIRDGMGTYDLRYRRRTAEDDRRNYEASIPGKIALGVPLTKWEYSRLTPEQKALGWVEIYISQDGYGMNPEKRYRRRTPDDDRANAKAKFEASIPGKVSLDIPLSKSEVDGLSPNLKSLGWLEITPGKYQKMNFVLNQPKITLTQEAYDSLTPTQKALFNWTTSELTTKEAGWFSKRQFRIMWDGIQKPRANWTNTEPAGRP